MSRFANYEHLAEEAKNETRKGGNSNNAIAFAILALAEAIVVTEDDGKRELSGAIIVDH